MELYQEKKASVNGCVKVIDPEIILERASEGLLLLDEVKESIINAYEMRTGLSRARLAHLMSSETWLNANMAIELGFADDLLFKVNKEQQPANGQHMAENGYTFSCKTVSNSLLAKIAAKMHKAAPAVTAVIQPPGAEPTAPPDYEPPDPPAPTVSEETVPLVAPASAPAASQQPAQAGVSVSGLERRLSLLRPYGVDPLTPSTQTAPTGTVNS